MVVQIIQSLIRPFALGLALFLPGAVQAQSVPPCQTTAGAEGLFFAGTHAMIFSPVDYDDVRSLGSEIQVFSDIRDGQGVLAYLGNPSEASVIEFVAEGAVVHQCLGRIVAFDPKVHSLTQLQSGDCALTLVSGRQKLLAGHAQLLEFPSDFAEVSMSAPGLVDISVVSSRWLYVLGKAPGLAVLAWISEGEAGVLSINLCPFAADSPETELAAGAPADAELCQDADGAPMRLGVGQVVQIAFRDAAGKEMQITEATMAAPKIADLSVKDNKSAVVTGVGPGWTSLTLIDFDSQRAMTCEIIVE